MLLIVILLLVPLAYYGVWKKRRQQPVLSPDRFQGFRLHSKNVVSHNVVIYRFKLPTETSILGLPIGQHISIGANIKQPDGSTKEIMRSYTPISGDDLLGYVDLLIKTYPGGSITQYLANLTIGDIVQIRGPKGAFQYRKNMVRRIGMVAGGTGITPMLQVLTAIVEGRSVGDKTGVDLIFANVTVEDILLKKELDKLAEDVDVNVYYVLNKPPSKWDGGVGFVTADMIQRWLPAPAPDVKILLCGPPPMCAALKKVTDELGYQKARAVSKTDNQVFVF